MMYTMYEMMKVRKATLAHQALGVSESKPFHALTSASTAHAAAVALSENVREQTHGISEAHLAREGRPRSNLRESQRISENLRESQRISENAWTQSHGISEAHLALRVS